MVLAVFRTETERSASRNDPARSATSRNVLHIWFRTVRFLYTLLSTLKGNDPFSTNIHGTRKRWEKILWIDKKKKKVRIDIHTNTHKRFRIYSIRRKWPPKTFIDDSDIFFKIKSNFLYVIIEFELYELYIVPLTFLSSLFFLSIVRIEGKRMNCTISK